MSYTEHEHIVTRNVEDEVKGSYLRYSMSVIISRALPDARDGLKPSQRRILFAMRQLNLSPNAKFRKCAKISGDTSGDYHPHGEQVIYPTLVRMAQDWVMRYTLIQGQGNFGSVDGDPPAAMRYTEAKLTHAAVQLMDDLDKETVSMVPNYDETKVEPSVFPAKFPNLVCNGSSGIAVGMATNIPPHNLKEVCKAVQLILANPQVTIDEIASVMPGPDFPTGGVICGQRGIREAYHTGRGKIILRGVLNVEKVEDSHDRERIIIEEIPYNVNKSRLIEAIADLINSKQITAISDIRDESDKDGLRIAIDLKRGEIAEVVINQLYKFSDLEITFGCNMLALDKGLPKTMNIKQMLTAWVEHRIDVIKKRTNFELHKAEARAHILEGYLKAIDHLDEVVKVIRASSSRDEAKTALMSQWEFTDRQANAVLDLRLYQLTGLEHDKINTEYQDLLKKIEHLRSVLASDEMVKDIIREEMDELIKQSPADRMTKIVSYESDVEMEDLIADTEVLITISEDDYIKRMPIDTFREQKRGGQGVAGVKLKKEDDAIKSLYTASMHDYLLIFTTHGRCLWLKVWQIPEGSRTAKGKPLINLLADLQENERIATILKTRNFKEEADIIMATEKGVVKRSELSHFSNPRKRGIIALAIDEGDALVAARLIGKSEKAMLFTYHGMAVRFDESKVRPMGRQARGVKGATLKDESDRVIALEVVKGSESILVVCENGFGKRSQVEDFRETNRGSSGVRSIITSERNGNVIAALRVDDNDSIVLMSASGQTVRISMKDVRVMGRNTQGVKLANVKEGDSLVSVQKLQHADEEVIEASEPATTPQ
ncbi:DNA topoisomerase (ATP-hydrolyzing) subunit A [Estrella lausannensis]|uniref:DNA gyrase subunit A n=1 Tax=Estrella lausannensis TaxID=483423 RepID=G1FGT8_9BACT|nr:DNA topoisomerase (ATP-hydrolyzing) subunit A [Estrella lausannensis]AEM01129.1 DNA gyrase subunit A [Estrella lausannensis]CRX39512.1 DNA gyrase subunit A [Estrella lausannensis]